MIKKYANCIVSAIKKTIKEKKSLKEISMLDILRLRNTRKGMIFFLSFAIAITINIMFSYFSLRLDLTKNSVYTPSATAKKIASKLEKNATITFYVSSDVGEYQPFKRDIKDFLEEFERMSNGKIKTRVIDPDIDQEERKKATEIGVNKFPIRQMQGGKFVASQIYFSLVVSYNDKNELIQNSGDYENVEYNLLSALYKLSKKDAVKIGVMGGNPQDQAMMMMGQNQNQDQTIPLVKEMLKNQFAIEDVDLSPPVPTPTPEGQYYSEGTTEAVAPLKEIDPSLKALFIFEGSDRLFSDKEVDSIKKYIDNKGKVVALVGGLQISKDTFAVSSQESKLVKLFGQYGINVKKDLVFSESSEIVSTGGGGQMSGGLIQNYPVWLKTNDVLPTPYTSGVNILLYPWVSSLDLSDKNKNDYITTPLVYAMENSWTDKGVQSIEIPSILSRISPNINLEKGKSIVVTARANKKNAGDIVVIPSQNFLQSTWVMPQRGNPPSNIPFVINLFNELALDGLFSGVSQRKIESYTLKPLKDNARDIVKFSLMFLSPLAFALFGAYRINKRK